MIKTRPDQASVVGRAALAAVLAMGAGLCLWGITFGLPHVYTPDEPSVVERALAVARSGDLNPHYFTYPHLVYDLQAAVLWLTVHALSAWPALAPRFPVLEDGGAYYLAARGVSVLCALLALALTYGMGRELGGSPWTGLLAALYLSVTPVFIQHAHYATVDGPSAAATALCGFACLRALHRAPGATAHPVSRPDSPGTQDQSAPYPSPKSVITWQHSSSHRWLALGAVGAGLAAGSKYNAALVLLCPLLTSAVLWRQTRDTAPAATRWRLGADLVGICAVAALTYLITTPYTVLDWPDFQGGVLGVARHYGATGHPGAEGNDNWRWYLGYLCGPGFGLPLMALALAGGMIGVVRRHAGSLVIGAFVVAYYILLSTGYVRFERNLLPLLPVLAGLAAAGTPWLATLLTRKTQALAGGFALALIVLVTVVPPAITAARQDEALTHTFTQSLALDWIIAHVPPGATVALENWEAPPLPPQRYRLVRVSALGKHDLAWYHGQGVTYLVADSWTDGAYLAGRDLYPVDAARYRQLFACSQQIGSLRGGGQDVHPGPDFTMYRFAPPGMCGARR